MQTQQSQNLQETEVSPLLPPPELESEEKWIVRIHGQDMGPFSSQAIYSKLLTGEIDPETLLLDQNSFTRCRLSEIGEFSPYLRLHNTQNPILLEEQRQQEKEKNWQESGRKRMFIGIFSSVTLIILSFVIWRFFIYQPEDIYLTDDKEKIAISLGSFKASNFGTKKKYNWKWKASRRRGKSSRGKGKKGSKGSGPQAAVMDFTKGGGSGIPRGKLQNTIKRHMSNVYSCFISQMQRDGNFSGGTTIFKINGALGRVTSVKMEEGSRGVLTRCVKRKSSGWKFPKFQGNAEIYIPVRLNRRRRY